MSVIPVVISSPVSRVTRYTWTNVTQADTCEVIIPGGTEPLIGSISVSGTFGSCTVALQGSNDGTNFYSLKDLGGSTIAITAAGAVEFTSAMYSFKPVASGGSSQSITITVVLRG